MLTPLGDAGQTSGSCSRSSSLGALAWLTYELGAHWFGPGGGRRRGARDPDPHPGPELRRARLRGHPVRRARAGGDPRRGARDRAARSRSSCSRSPACCGPRRGCSRSPTSPGGATSRLLPLALAAPVLWMLHDLVLAGNPLHSLTGTRDNAEMLQRITGLDDVPLTVPRRLGEILREPGLLGAAAGGVLVLAFMRRRAALPIAAGFVSIAAFCVLAAAGLPILGRYLLLPAALLAVFCGAGVVRLAAARARAPVAQPLGGDRRRRARRLRRLRARPGEPDLRPARARCARSPRSSPTCTRSATRSRCRPVAVPNHRPVPHVALWTGIPPQRDRLRPARAADAAASTSTRRASACCATSRSTRATRSA